MVSPALSTSVEPTSTRLTDPQSDSYDLPCRLRATLGQITDFTGTTANPRLTACARRFCRRIQRRDIGLESNTIDYADNIGDFARTKAISRIVCTTLSTTLPPFALFQGAQCRVTGLTDVFGVLFHGGGQLFHTGGLFQRRCCCSVTGRDRCCPSQSRWRRCKMALAPLRTSYGTHQFALHMT